MALVNAIGNASTAIAQLDIDDDGRFRMVQRQPRADSATGGTRMYSNSVYQPDDHTASNAIATGPSQWQGLRDKLTADEKLPSESDVVKLMRSTFMHHLMSGSPEYAKYFKNDIRLVRDEAQKNAGSAAPAAPDRSHHSASTINAPHGYNYFHGHFLAHGLTHSHHGHGHGHGPEGGAAGAGGMSLLARYRASPLRAKIYLTMSHPEYSNLAFAIGMFVLCVIILNTAVFCVESIPAYEGTAMYDRLVIVDYVCLGIFTVEYLVRLLTCSNLRHFIWSFMNWIDLVAIAPFYIELMVVGVDSGNRAASQTRVIRVVRLLRVLRLMRATTRFRNLQVVIDALVASSDVMGMLMFLLLVLLVVSATIIYFVETALVPGTGFDSIPLSMWYMQVTLTTTGYGDYYPQSSWGRFIAGVFMLLCMVTMSLPISVVGGNFSTMWGRYTAIRDGIERSGGAWSTFTQLQGAAVKHGNAMDNLIGTVNQVKCVLDDGGVLAGQPRAEGLKALQDELGELQAKMERLTLLAEQPDPAIMRELRAQAAALQHQVDVAKSHYVELQALLHVGGRLSSKEVTEKLDKLHAVHKEMAGWALDGGWVAGQARLLLSDLQALREVVEPHEEGRGPDYGYEEGRRSAGEGDGASSGEEEEAVAAGGARREV